MQGVQGRLAAAGVILAMVGGSAVLAQNNSRPKAADPMAAIQGDWPNAGTTITVKGSSAKVARLSDKDRKAGYAEGDLLVQGLTYARAEKLADGSRKLSYDATCRSRDPAGGPKAWIVTDCTLAVIVPAEGQTGPSSLRVSGAKALIRGDRGSSVALAGPTPAPAKVATAEPAAPAPPADPNDTWSRRTMDPSELAAQDAGTNQLNAQVKANLEAADARDAKKQADFRAAVAAREAKIRADQAAYDKQQADYRARIAATEAANAKARADWEADVAACRAGDRTRCAKN